MEERRSKQPDDELYVDPVIEAYKKGIDITILRENLKLTPQQRAENLQALLESIAEMNRAGEAMRQKQRNE